MTGQATHLRSGLAILKRVIGFEKLNFSLPASEKLRLAFEAGG
jgi:hypothetical protein